MWVTKEEPDVYKNGHVSAVYEDGFEVRFEDLLFFIAEEEFLDESFTHVVLGTRIDLLEVDEYGEILKIEFSKEVWTKEELDMIKESQDLLELFDDNFLSEEIKE